MRSSGETEHSIPPGRRFERSSRACLGVCLLFSGIAAGSSKPFPEGYSDVYMPISLAPAVVRTPEFPVDKMGYSIIIQADRHPPLADQHPTLMHRQSLEPDRSLSLIRMECMMAIASVYEQRTECHDGEPLLIADWKVWNGNTVIAQGSSPTHGGEAITADRIWKEIGAFGGQKGQRFVVEVSFKKDASVLDVTNPHLIVIQHGRFW